VWGRRQRKSSGSPLAKFITLAPLPSTGWQTRAMSRPSRRTPILVFNAPPLLADRDRTGRPLLSQREKRGAIDEPGRLLVVEDSSAELSRFIGQPRVEQIGHVVLALPGF